MVAALSDTGPIEILRQPRKGDDAVDDRPQPRSHSRSELVEMVRQVVRKELGPDASTTMLGKVDEIAARVGEVAKRDDAGDPATQMADAIGAAVAGAISAAIGAGRGGGGSNRNTLIASVIVGLGLLGSPVVEQTLHSDSIERMEGKIDQMERTINGLSSYTWDLQRCAKGEIPCPSQPPASVRIAAAEAEQDTAK